MNNLLVTLANAANVWTYILGGIVAVLALVLSVIVAMQPSKEGGGLSGTIAGSGSDSFFGKSKAMTKERLLPRLTLILSIVFVVLVLVLVILTATMATK